MLGAFYKDIHNLSNHVMLKHFILAVAIAYVLRTMFLEFVKKQGKLDSMFRDDKIKVQCPHNLFVRKHLCPNCTTERDALEVSKRRLDFSPTMVNGVLFGSKEDHFWEKVTNLNEHKTLCKNKVGWVHFTCNVNANRCRRNGKNCFTLHDTENGHFYYQKTICMY